MPFGRRVYGAKRKASDNDEKSEVKKIKMTEIDGSKMANRTRETQDTENMKDWERAADKEMQKKLTVTLPNARLRLPRVRQQVSNMISDLVISDSCAIHSSNIIVDEHLYSTTLKQIRGTFCISLYDVECQILHHLTKQCIVIVVVDLFSTGVLSSLVVSMQRCQSRGEVDNSDTLDVGPITVWFWYTCAFDIGSVEVTN